MAAAAAAARPVRWLLLAALAHRCLALLLLLLCAHLQRPFDASAPAPPAPLLRWDSTHFLAIAAPHSLRGAPHGYAYEHTAAFMPGTPALLRVAGSGLGLAATWSSERAAWGASIACLLAGAACPALLYLLSVRHFAPRFALLAAQLSILAPAPMSLVTPTPEAPFALLFLAMCLLLAPPAGARAAAPPLNVARFVAAALLGALTTVFRANGMLSAGLLLWTLLWDLPRGWSARTLPRLLLLPLALVPIVPFALMQIWLHGRMCHAPEEARLSQMSSSFYAGSSESVEWRAPEWCSSWRGAYGSIQARYWNVGFLRYWTIAQVPNFLLAAPVLVPLLHYLWRYYLSVPQRIARRTLLPFLPASAAGTAPSRSSAQLLPASALPLMHHTLLSTALLLFVAHTQIALRFSAAMPAVWWAFASWFVQPQGSRPGDTSVLDRRSSRLLSWLVLWNVASLVLGAGFYPPA